MPTPEELIRIPLPWLSGQLGSPRHVLARPLSAAEFFAAMPDVFPGTECYGALPGRAQRETAAAVESWAEAVARASLVSPSLDPDDDLGPDWPAVILTLFRAWGWVQREDGSVVGLPGENLREILRRLSKATGVRPSEWMKLPVNEWIFDFHVLLGDSLKRRGAGRARVSLNDPGGPEEIEASEMLELVDG